VKKGNKRGSQLRTNRVRTKDGRSKELRYGRKQAVHTFCTECLGWEQNPADCTDPMCPLYPFRGRTQATLRGERGAG